MVSLIVGSSQVTPPATASEPVDFGSPVSVKTSSGDRFFRRTTDHPYGERLRKLIGDAQRIGAASGQTPDILVLHGMAWLVLPMFPTYRGVRFRVEGNRLRLLRNPKDCARG